MHYFEKRLKVAPAQCFCLRLHFGFMLSGHRQHKFCVNTFKYEPAANRIQVASLSRGTVVPVTHMLLELIEQDREIETSQFGSQTVSLQPIGKEAKVGNNVSLGA